jgi:hypothetical protein
MMTRYVVGIEDVVASALIELMHLDPTNRRVSLRALEAYGSAVSEALASSGKNAILLATRESTYEFVRNHADCFSIEKRNNVEYMELDQKVSEETLRRKFRRNLTVDLAKALAEDKSVGALKASFLAERV